MKFEGLKSIISFISLYFVFSPYYMSILSPFFTYFGMHMQINPISKLNIVRSCLIIHRPLKTIALFQEKWWKTNKKWIISWFLRIFGHFHGTLWKMVGAASIFKFLANIVFSYLHTPKWNHSGVSIWISTIWPSIAQPTPN